MSKKKRKHRKDLGPIITDVLECAKSDVQVKDYHGIVSGGDRIPMDSISEEMKGVVPPNIPAGYYGIPGGDVKVHARPLTGSKRITSVDLENGDIHTESVDPDTRLAMGKTRYENGEKIITIPGDDPAYNGTGRIYQSHVYGEKIDEHGQLDAGEHFDIPEDATHNGTRRIYPGHVYDAKNGIMNTFTAYDEQVTSTVMTCVAEDNAPATAEEPDGSETVEPVAEPSEEIDTGKVELAQLDPDKQMEVLKNYNELVSMEARKSSLYSEVDAQRQKVADMKEHVLKDVAEDESGFIEEKLLEVTSVDELMRRISTQEGLDYFYTNPATGQILDVTVGDTSKDRENFKRGFLKFLLENRLAMEGIDEELKKYEQAIADFDVDTRDAIAALSDNVLTYVDYVRRSTPEDHPNYKKIMEQLRYIESAYNMDVFRETVEKYPSIIKHTLEDVHSERRIKEIGGRYFGKLASAKVNASLMAFMNDDPQQSFEYKALLPNQYKAGYENLFIFSLIRFFAMESWTDPNIKKLHASTIIALRKLVSGDITDELKESMRDYIAKYLALFA